MTRSVCIVAFERFQLLDLAGPADVFRAATLLAPGAAYEVEVVTPGGAPVRSDSGVEVAADRSLTTAARGRGALDTVLVVGGLGIDAAATEPTFRADVAALVARSERIASVCSGAFGLAAAGLLDGHRATTHWASCPRLAELHPAIEVEPDQIYVHDRDRWTSAGVTAGIDLALAFVEHDLGPEIAHAVAGWLVVFVQRTGGQAQFSAQLRARPAQTEAIRAVQRWLPDHLTDDLSVGTLARRALMSERGFARRFRAETGATPAAHVEALRIEAARNLLETTDLTVSEVARAVGLGRPETLHRAFARQVGTTPDRYRRHFGRRGVLTDPPDNRSTDMQIAIGLYDGFTALDFVGPYQVFTNVPGLDVVLCAERTGPVHDDNGLLHLDISHTFADVPTPDVLLVPGGFVTRKLAAERHPIVEWIAAAHPHTTWTTSVCTGSLLLGAAGILDGLPATTHWCAYDSLASYGALPTEQRVVTTGKIVTGAGVSAGIDLGLTLVATMFGDDMAKAVQLGIEYDPQPPFDSGSPSKAPGEIRELVEAVVAQNEGALEIDAR